MIGADERRKIMSQFEDDPVYPHIVVLKCLAALLFLVIVAAGPWVILATNDQSAGAVAEQPVGSTQPMSDGQPGNVASTE